MKKHISYPCILLLSLAGCVHPDPIIGRLNSCQIYTDWVQNAECRDQVVESDPRYSNTPTYQLLVSYREMLIEKVKKGKISEAEANYAFQQKINEINQQAAQERNATMERNAIISQQNTNQGSTTNCQALGNQLSCQTIPENQTLGYQMLHMKNAGELYNEMQ